ncbi:hypothetical protein A2U01_0012993 [Trifolium medium]|uniref:Uncharacterized protein n=1 Tax=Trifolium medium TaxID=97028 RepID=A0A392MX34_9FABA|nr:hypothetical protein [Trifolium medium]
MKTRTSSRVVVDFWMMIPKEAVVNCIGDGDGDSRARLKEFLVHLKSYETRLKELKAKIKNLKNARDTVQHKVDVEDKRYGNGIPKEVTDWIKARQD